MGQTLARSRTACRRRLHRVPPSTGMGAGILFFFGGPRSLAHQDAVAEPVSARVAGVLPRPYAALLGEACFIWVFVGIHQNQQADIAACFHRRCPHRGILHQVLETMLRFGFMPNVPARSVEGILLSRNVLHCPSYQRVRRKQRSRLSLRMPIECVAEVTLSPYSFNAKRL